jgi:hypothetical protein
MLKMTEKPARFAGSLAQYKALSVTLGVTFAIRAAPIRDSAAAAAEWSAPVAKFTRPAGVPFPAENPCSPECRTRAKTVLRPPDVGLRHHFLRHLPSPQAGLGRRPAA